ncbi:MAG: hypothetical protein KDC57_05380 [Saprospiraceae bacterium]|nr:hypothetical protein [Saprospiraceae bacterium]
MKAFNTVLGFLLFLFGLLSIILNLVGLQFSFLTWMENLGRLGAFVLRLIMVLAGIVIMYLNLVDWKKDNTSTSG